VPKKVEDAVKGASVSLLLKNDPKAFKLALSLLIEKTLMDFGQEFNEHQLYSAVEKICIKYWFLKIDELAFVLNKATLGEYGQVYGKVTVVTIMSWLHKYDVEERITYIRTKNSTYKETADSNRSSEQLDKNDTADFKKIREQFIKNKLQKNG